MGSNCIDKRFNATIAEDGEGKENAELRDRAASTPIGRLAFPGGHALGLETLMTRQREGQALPLRMKIEIRREELG